MTAQTRYWEDTSGRASLDDVRSLPSAQLLEMGRARSFKLRDGALWIRLDLPALDPSLRWYLAMAESAFTHRVDFFQSDAEGVWQQQQAGDHIPVDDWSVRDRAPTFALDTANLPGTVWMRLENRPPPLSPRLYLRSELELQGQRHQA